ncbi:MAG: phasin family protein [Alphaproteobacteria bacterium]|nr:phasin family protein [Alphaproteobacteria bacterium]
MTSPALRPNEPDPDCFRDMGDPLPRTIDDHATSKEMDAWRENRERLNALRRAAALRMAELTRAKAQADAPRLTLPPEPSLPERSAAVRSSPQPEHQRWLQTAQECPDWVQLSLLLIDFAEANLRRNLEMARALLGATNFEEARERHAAFMRETAKLYADQAAELAALTGGETPGA